MLLRYNRGPQQHTVLRELYLRYSSRFVCPSRNLKNPEFCTGELAQSGQ